MVTEELSFDLYGAVEKAILTLGGVSVSSRPAPVDAPDGTVYLSIDKITASGEEDATVAVKLRYFPVCGYCGGGADIYSLIKSVSLGGVSYPIKKYECSIERRHLDISASYVLPVSYAVSAYGNRGDGALMDAIRTQVTLL